MSIPSIPYGSQTVALLPTDMVLQPFAFSASPGLAQSPPPPQYESSYLKFKEGAYVFRENEAPKGFYFLKSGALKIVTFRPLTRGRVASSEFINKLVGPGEYFGFKPVLQGSSYNFYAKALANSEVVLYKPEALYHVEHLGRDVMQQMAKDLENHERNAQLHYLASVQERIAYQLAILAERFGTPAENGISIQLRLTRNELAQLAGTINESLSRHLTEFKTLGLLDVHGKEIVVKNLQALKDLSGNFKS